MTRKLVTKADPVKARTRSMYATLRRRANGAEVMTLEELRAEFELFMQSGALCRYCRTRVTHKTVSLDHMIPVNQGGWHMMSNLAFVCQSCNKAKGNHTDAEFKSLLKHLHEWEKENRNFKLSAGVLSSMKVSASFRIGANRRARRTR